MVRTTLDLFFLHFCALQVRRLLREVEHIIKIRSKASGKRWSLTLPPTATTPPSSLAVELACDRHILAAIHNST